MKKESSVNECALCHLIFILPQTLAEHLKRLHPEIGNDETTKKSNSDEHRNLFKLKKKHRKSKKKRHLSAKSVQDFKSAILLEHKQNLQKVELVQKNDKLNLCNLSDKNLTVPKMEIVKHEDSEVINNYFQRNIPKPLKCDDDTRIIGIVSSKKSYELKSITKTEPEAICDLNTGDNQLKSIIKTESEVKCDVDAEDNQLKSITKTEPEAICDVNTGDNQIKSTIKTESEEMCDVDTEGNQFKSIIKAESEEMCDVDSEDNQLKSIIMTESEKMCDVNSEDNQLKAIIKTESEEMCDVDSEDKVEYSSIKDANTAKGTIFYESKENIVANEAYPLVQGYLLKGIDNKILISYGISRLHAVYIFTYARTTKLDGPHSEGTCQI